MKKPDEWQTRYSSRKERKRGKHEIIVGRKVFSSQYRNCKNTARLPAAQKIFLSLRIHAENYFLSLINLWLESSYLFPTCGSNRSHLTIPSYRSIEASVGCSSPVTIAELSKEMRRREHLTIARTRRDYSWQSWILRKVVARASRGHRWW